MLPSQVYIETKVSAKPAHGRGVTAHCAERKTGWQAPALALLPPWLIIGDGSRPVKDCTSGCAVLDIP